MLLSTCSAVPFVGSGGWVIAWNEEVTFVFETVRYSWKGKAFKPGVEIVQRTTIR